MDNYIVINGKKAELTEEQLEKLGIKVKKETPFARNVGEAYYYIQAFNTVMIETDENTPFDTRMYNTTNYFNDKDFAQQVAYHELLNRLLLKYAYEHDAVDCNWGKSQEKKFYITWDNTRKKFYVDWAYNLKSGGDVYFNNEEVTNGAIQDVVIPFMVKYLDFVW